MVLRECSVHVPEGCQTVTDELYSGPKYFENPQEFRMAPIISVQNLTKTYANGFEALKGIN
ncbi:hypothetical protein ACE04B_30700, partial [Rhizobium phaseoli]